MQAKSTILTLEDMMKVCFLEFKGYRDDHLPLIEFTFNNSFYSSIQMAQFEAFYGRRYRLPMGGYEVAEMSLIETDFVIDAMGKVRVTRERLKASQSRQMSYSEKGP